MKILHTSDWHLGATLHGLGREHDHIQTLESIVDIVSSEKPDAVLLTGDVFNVPQPSASSQRLFGDTLDMLLRRVPETRIIVTAGNHDSGARLEAYRRFMSRHGVTLVGRFDRENIENHIVEIPGKGFVVAVPYVYERNIPSGWFAGVLASVAGKNTRDLPIVMTAHTTVAGVSLENPGYATDRVIGGIDALPYEVFGSGFDYLALGHIHKPQFVAGSGRRARYCGTPLAISFDEAYPHGVDIVEIGKRGDVPAVRRVEITPAMPLVTLPARGSAVWEEVLGMLERFPDDLKAYVRLNVEVDDFLPSEAMATAMRVAENKQCVVCHINAVRRERNHDEYGGLTVGEFKTMAPMDIARLYAESIGVDFSDDMENMFSAAIQELMEEEGDV